MSFDNFVPEVWSARVLNSFEGNYVFRGLCNTDYEGEIKNAGDTVRINTPGDITVSDYAGSVTYEEPGSTQQSLLIDQQKYFAFKVPNIDAVQANVSLVDKYSKKAGQAMAKAVDMNLAALYTGVGETVALDVSSNSDSVWTALNECNQKLDENDVPESGRWLVVSPLVYAKFKNHSAFTHASELGDGILRTGQLGEMDGFAIFKSNNIVVATQHKCVFGTMDAITFAAQIVLSQAGQMENEISDYVRGLFVFGRKVVQPEAYGLLNVTVA